MKTFVINIVKYVMHWWLLLRDLREITLWEAIHKTCKFMKDSESKPFKPTKCYLYQLVHVDLLFN